MQFHNDENMIQFKLYSVILGSMKSVFSVTFMIAILSTMAVVAAVDVMPEAEAKKSQGVYNSKFGSATKGIVCGDRLCSEIENPKSSEKKSYMPNKSTSSPMKTSVGSSLVDSISGATMIDTNVDKHSGTMVISIDAHDDGKIKLTLPQAIDEAFMVLVDGEEWDDSYIDGNNIKVYFHAGAEKIEVIGNSSN